MNTTSSNTTIIDMVWKELVEAVEDKCTTDVIRLSKVLKALL